VLLLLLLLAEALVTAVVSAVVVAVVMARWSVVAAWRTAEARAREASVTMKRERRPRLDGARSRTRGSSRTLRPLLASRWTAERAQLRERWRARLKRAQCRRQLVRSEARRLV